MTVMPLISVVMPSYNQGAFIGEAIESIVSQSYPNKELIVIDGGSTDDTVSILRAWEHKLAYWISEPDSGQVEALIKGISRSRGEIVNWINSDDVLLEGSLARIAEHFDGADALAGPVINFGIDRREEVRRNSGLTARGLIEMHRRTRYHQPGIWLRGDILRANVRDWLHTELKYVFDWALYARYFNRHRRVVYIDRPIARFRYHDQSKTVREGSKFEKERLMLLEQMAMEKEFFALSRHFGDGIRRMKFRVRLSELEGAVDDGRSRVTASDLARLVSLHPTSARRMRNMKRIVALACANDFWATYRGGIRRSPRQS
jgi:glycosyltransferase involved in cell wall biosynthesis